MRLFSLKICRQLAECCAYWLIESTIIQSDCIVGSAGEESLRTFEWWEDRVLRGSGKKPSIKKLSRAADAYEENLLNKNILLVGVWKDRINYIELRFLGRHFQHLTGVKTKENISAKLFWKKCKNHELSEGELKDIRGGFVGQKLAIARQLFMPEGSMKSFGSPNGSRLNVEVDFFAGDHRGCMGFKKYEGTYYDPNTLLKASVDGEIRVRERFKVVGVFSKATRDRGYRNALRVDTRVDWDSIAQSLPNELSHVAKLL